MLTDHLIAGVGPGNYPVLFRDYARKVGNDPRVSGESTHSLPLQIASEEGLVGVVGWIGAGILLIRIGRTAGITRTPIGRAIVIAIGTYLTASLYLMGASWSLSCSSGYWSLSLVHLTNSRVSRRHGLDAGEGHAEEDRVLVLGDRVGLGTGGLSGLPRLAPGPPVAPG